MGVDHASQNSGDIIAQVLIANKVKHLFTLCGGHISPILVGAKKHGIQIIDVRHEAHAVFAADATSRISDGLGVAAVTAGPGITNTITALRNALSAQSPLLLLGGAAPTLLQGKGALQDIDQMRLIKPNVKKAFAVRRVKDITPLLSEAIKTAREGVPGPVFVELPVDILYDEQLIREWHEKALKNPVTLQQKAMAWYVKRHLNKVFSLSDSNLPKPVVLPEPSISKSDLQKVAQELEKAKRPLLVIGSGAMMQNNLAAELANALEKLNVPVYASGMARGLLGRNNPLQFRHKRREAIKAADLVILAGVPLDFRLDYGSYISAKKLVSINRSQEDLTRNKKPRIAIQTDPAAFLIALAEKVSSKSNEEWLVELESRETARDEEIGIQAQEKIKGGINPVSLFMELEAFAADDAIFIADGGDFVGTASYILKPRKPLSWLDPGVFGTLGVGGGFATAAKVCNPEAEVYLLLGDGSSAYSLMETDTFHRLGLPVTLIIGNDGAWNQIARDQVEILKDDVGTVLSQSDYHKVAKAFVGDGERVKTLKEFTKALKTARKANNKGQSFIINAILAKSDFRKGSLSM